MQGRDRLERVAKSEDAAVARGGVDAGHGAVVQIGHPEAAVRVGLLASAVARLVRVHGLAGVVVDFVHGALGLVGSPEVAAAHREVGELRFRHGRGRGDRVRRRVDPVDAVTALDPDGSVAEDDAAGVGEPAEAMLHPACRGADAQQLARFGTSDPERAVALRESRESVLLPVL